MNRFMRFMKKQGTYIMIGVCVLLVAAVITLSVLFAQKPVDNTPVVNVPGGEEPGGEDPVPPPAKLKFTMPVSADAVENYNEWFKVYGNTMAPHCGVDFKVDAGTKVTASYSGVVESADTNGRGEYTLVIKYDNGYIATYKGLDGKAKLDGNVVLSKGSQVAQGDHIGTVASQAVSCNSDVTDVHLHFELRDPANTAATNYVDPMTIFGEVEEK